MPVILMGPEGPITVPVRHCWNRYDTAFLLEMNISPLSVEMLKTAKKESGVS
jgi:hypothetical protein